MPQPFWDPGAQNVTCFLPDVSQQEVLPDRWNWDVIYLAGRRVPGLVEVDFKREHRANKRLASGVDGTSVTSLGYNGADIVVRIRLWTPQQWLDFQTITIPSVQPRPGKASVRPVSITADYPSLATWGCFRLFVLHVDGPKKCEVHGARDIILSCSDTSPQVAVGVATQKGAGVATEKNAITGTSGPTSTAAPSKTTNTPKLGQ